MRKNHTNILVLVLSTTPYRSTRTHTRKSTLPHVCYQTTKTKCTARYNTSAVLFVPQLSLKINTVKILRSEFESSEIMIALQGLIQRGGGHLGIPLPPPQLLFLTQCVVNDASTDIKDSSVILVILLVQFSQCYSLGFPLIKELQEYPQN